MILALLLACGAYNRAPRILSVNGVEVKKDVFGDLWLDEDFVFARGEQEKITLDVLEPDLQKVEVWWPQSPPGWEFPKDGLEGTWDVPLDYEPMELFLDLIVTDTASDPAFSSLTVVYVSEDVYDTAYWF